MSKHCREKNYLFMRKKIEFFHFYLKFFLYLVRLIFENFESKFLFKPKIQIQIFLK